MPTYYNYTENGVVYSFDDVFVPAESFYREGELWAWGNGAEGKLGLNDLNDISTPTTVGGINWKQISAGNTHTAAIKSDGTLWVWGNGSDGRLGTNNTISRSTPVTTFAGGTNWQQVSVGSLHTSAIKTDGTLWVWGNASLGQLGTNATLNRSTPVTTFAGGTDWQKVSLGSDFSSALKTDGILWTWGNAASGQLGANTTINRSTPITAFGVSREWMQLSNNGPGGVKTDGTLWVWGPNLFGVTGIIDNILTPVTTLVGGNNWKQVDHGTNFTVGLKTDGTLWVWGNKAYLYGAYGLLSTSVPVTTFAGGTNWADTATGDEEELYTLSASNAHTAAIKTDGTLWIWGNNNVGRLGTDDIINRSTPSTTIIGGTNWKQVSTGYSFTTAVKTDGSLWSWGNNFSSGYPLGRFTSSTISTASIPLKVPGGDWKDTATGDEEELYTLSAGGFANFLNVGSYYSAAIKSDGTLWTWGYSSQGQLGNNSGGSTSTPNTTFAGGTNWKQISTGRFHTAAIKTDGTLWTWGTASSGQLGTNNTTPIRYTPITTFVGGTDWKQVSAGNDFSAAIKTDGTLWTWGTTSYIGRPTFSGYEYLPVTTFAGGTNWADTATGESDELFTLAAGTAHSAAVKADGTLWVWGGVGFGRIGTNDISPNRFTPVTTFAGGTDWKLISSGGLVTAAVKTDGTLWTWGYNGQRGLLGINLNQSSSARSTPVTTFAGGTDWKQVSVGPGSSSTHCAAVKTDGTLWTWGYNGGIGALGINLNQTSSARFTPVTTFAGGTDWKQVSVGYRYNAAIKTDGTLWTWGESSNGQLGNNTVTRASTPITTFAGGTDWKQVSAGDSHVAAVKTDGTLWVWGNGRDGRLGTNDTTNRSTPVTTFAGGTDWKQVSGGTAYTAAVKTDGTLWTWGNNNLGQLGSADTTFRSTPITTVIGGTSWKQVTAGGSHTLALQDDGVNKELYVFGNHGAGQLGIDNGSNINSIPGIIFPKTSNGNWRTVTCGASHSSAIKTDGTLWTWGSGSNGRLGTNDTTYRPTPVTTFAGGTNWKQVSAGYYATAAVKTDGTLWTWGNNSSSQLGRGIFSSTAEPLPVQTFTGGTNWADTATEESDELFTLSTSGPTTQGRGFSAAIKTDGTLWVWGNNTSAQLGVNDTFNRSIPTNEAFGATNWKQISNGATHSAAVKTNGTLWVWGANTALQLGRNNALTQDIPATTFAGGTDWKQVSGGTAYTAAVKTDGTLWIWGQGSNGKLGTNDVGNRSTPVTTFAGGTDWKQVSSGYNHTLAIKTDGSLWSWGSNSGGRLGRLIVGTDEYYPITTFAGGTNWADTATTNSEDLYTLTAGASHSGAIKADGTLWVWGNNANGQLGVNDATTRSTAVTTFAGGTDWKQISFSTQGASGTRFSAAIKTDGTLWVWGNNNSGQLGTNDTINRPTPVTTFAGGTNWKQVSAGDLHIAAIKTDGTLWTWGNGLNGFLGTNATLNRSTPVTTFAGGTDWKQVSAGYGVAAVKTDGTLWLWGTGTFGNLGNGATQNISTPVTTFAGGTDWKQVSFGSRFITSAVKTDGTLWIWGYNQSANLGIFDNGTQRNTPVTTFVGGTDWKQVSAGGFNTTAVKTDGTLWVWGNNSNGQLGVGDTNTRSTPTTTFIGGTNWKQVSTSSGSNFTLALQDDGVNKQLYVFGNNSVGQLGINFYNSANTSIPSHVHPKSATDWKQVTAGYSHSAAVKTDGTLWVWGANTNKVLGIFEDNGGKVTPVTTFAGGTNWKQVSAGNNHTAAVKTDGTLWTWGNAASGRLGDLLISGVKSTPITTFAGGTDWKQVSAGSDMTIALKDDGVNKEIYVFGDDSSGQLGINGGVGSSNPSIPVQAFPGNRNGYSDTGWKQVSAGARAMAAVRTDGTLWTWGTSTTFSNGQLGNNNNISASGFPITTFAGGTNWKQVYAGPGHTLAFADDGKYKDLYAFGNRGYSSGTGDALGIFSSPSIPGEVFGYDRDWKQVSSGGSDALSQNYSVAIKTDGTLWTWGQANSGQLGNNTASASPTPSTTFAGGSDWKQASAGNRHIVAVKTDGTLWVWGNNNSGQLGTNNVITRSTPVTTFTGGTDWNQVSAGTDYTAAVKTDGTLWVWGNNNSGQLGTNDTTNRSTPVTTFAGGTDWKQVTVGNTHSAAVKTDGTLWTWGTGKLGELGNGTLDDTLTPVTTVIGGTNWKQVSVGTNYTVALNDDGTNKRLYVFGDQVDGKLGTFISDTFETTPLPVFGNSTDWKQVSANATNVGAVKTDGTLWTWGNGTFGKLGTNDTTNRSTPVTTFAGGTNWKQVSAGNNHTTAIKTDGTLWTWGLGTSGQLGGNNLISRSTPVTTFAGGTDWKQVSTGANHNAVVKTNGTLWTWGVGSLGQLGTNNTIPRSVPIQVFGSATTWAQVSASLNTTTAVKTDGTLWTWGNNTQGQLGINDLISKSIPVTTFVGGNTWKNAATNPEDLYTITVGKAIKTDGILWTWGNGTSGELGNNDTFTRSTPVTILTSYINWKNVSAGNQHMIATRDDGTLWTWGLGTSGELGNNETITRSIPVTTFTGGTNWTKVSAGGDHSAAIKTDGTLWVWGNGSSGVLGTNDTLSRSIPVTTFTGGTNWKLVTSGSAHKAAIKTDGTLWTWGSGSDGRLGTNDTTDRSTPVTTFLGKSNWKEVSAGDTNTIGFNYIDNPVI